jgi:glycosyltransferase involved in cell wall biosynthesis
MIGSTDAKAPAARKSLISVCIVTYNQQDYIRDAVMSVLAQVNPAEFDLQILVGDDGSTDSTPEILQELLLRYPDCMTVVTHRPNVGAAGNYQALMRRAQGDFIAHLDGDDFWLPGKLSAQLAFLNHHQKCSAVYTGAIVVDAQGLLVGGFSNAQPELIDFDHLLARGNFLNHSSLMYRAQSLDMLCKLQTPFIDYLIHLKLAQQGHLGLLPAAYVVYRRMTSTSMLKNQFSHFDDLYLQTIVTMATEAPEAVRYSCGATYIVNTLGTHPSWCKEKDFWFRVTSLMRRLRLGPFRLLMRMVGVVFSGARKILSVRVSRLLYRSNTLIIVHPRH